MRNTRDLFMAYGVEYEIRDLNRYEIDILKSAEEPLINFEKTNDVKILTALSMWYNPKIHRGYDDKYLQILNKLSNLKDNSALHHLGLYYMEKRNYELATFYFKKSNSFDSQLCMQEVYIRKMFFNLLLILYGLSILFLLGLILYFLLRGLSIKPN